MAMEDNRLWEVVTGPGFDEQAQAIFETLFPSPEEAVKAIQADQERIADELECDTGERADLFAGRAHKVDWDDDGTGLGQSLLVIQRQFVVADPPAVKIEPGRRHRPSPLAERSLL
jgi:hypothetical protein